MLRIKEEIDLKELEKFGFEKVNLCFGECDYYEKTGLDYCSKFWISVRSKVIHFSNAEYDVDFDLLDVLYDLITAGYVEKVEE